jgi:carbonic anhydrase/acetyltransferase-like protein (isoleucine patch superfamily)
MSHVKFPVNKPEYAYDDEENHPEGEGFKMPLLREICPRLGWTLGLFVDPDLEPHQAWYPMVENGDADLDLCKNRFKLLAQELPRLFPTMYQTERARDSDLHHALTDIGGIHYYGGWRRKFDDSARLQGPLWAGMDVSLRSSCKVLGPTALGSRVTIGTAAIVNRSIIGGGTEVDAGAQVADSIIGRNVYIGPSVLLLHKSLIGEMKSIREGVRLLHRKKCGVIVGDGCRIGAGAKIEPGSVLMPGCVIPVGEYLQTGIYFKEDFQL